MLHRYGRITAMSYVDEALLPFAEAAMSRIDGLIDGLVAICEESEFA